MSGPAQGVLLVNLGTPDQARGWAVARYLREFLMDPLVVDIPWLFRALLVYLIIVPFRSPKSAHAYAKVWRNPDLSNPDGSPLKHFHLSLTRAVAQHLAPLPVKPAMRYGSPSLRQGLAELKALGVKKVSVVPLYPQFAQATTTSTMIRARQLAQNMGLQVEFVEDFFAHPEFIAAEEAVAKENLARDYDHYLFSFHGLPERQVQRLVGPRCQAREGCCDTVAIDNRHCYRAQCVASAKAIAGRLGLKSYSVAFQSRLGRTPWIGPYTDHVLAELAQAGVKRLAVFCPSFVADCLETLEEIEMRGREQFLTLGGEELHLVPSLNDHPRWVEAVATMVRERNGQGLADWAPK